MAKAVYPYLSLVSTEGYGTIKLNDVFTTDFGVEALAGVTGLGLPPVQVQWREAAGHGSQFRGQRVLSRDIDIPIYVRTKNRTGLKDRLRKLALVLSGEVKIVFHESANQNWFVKAHRVGGGEFIYGEDTNGRDDLLTVLTFRAGDPFWESSQVHEDVWQVSGGRGLLKAGGSLVRLGASNSQAFGTHTLNNPGDAEAYPTWHVTGPCSSFSAASRGMSFNWQGILVEGETLTINTYTGRVLDGSGSNRYKNFAAAPRLFTLPPGGTKVTVNMTGAFGPSKVRCTWRPRKWLVI